MPFDPYTELGISRDASPEDVKAAYRARAKQTHPDGEGSDTAFNRTSRAYLILKDPKRRDNYDRTGSTEDVEPENPISGPTEVILYFFSNVMQLHATGQVENIWQQDLIDTCRQHVRNEITKLDELIPQIERGIAFLEKLASKLEYKPARAPANSANTDRNPYLILGLKWQAVQIIKHAAKMREKRKAHEEALVVLDDYVMVVEHPEPQETSEYFWHHDPMIREMQTRLDKMFNSASINRGPST